MEALLAWDERCDETVHLYVHSHLNNSNFDWHVCSIYVDHIETLFGRQVADYLIHEGECEIQLFAELEV